MIEKYIDMQTNEDFNLLNKPGDIIKNGGLVLFPTETVYGIGANGLDDEAVKKIFLAKGRAQDNPLILHVSDMNMVEKLTENISELEYRLMDAFWPGPFTIILDKKTDIAKQATCGGDTVGVRMPSSIIARELIKRAGVPVAAPSANISGKPSGTNVRDIIVELQEKVDYVIDGGESEIGLESTVVRVVDGEVKILRPGKITKEDIEKIVNNVEVDKHVMEQLSNGEKVLSPGMKYRHYAPATHCKLIYSKDSNGFIEEVEKVARNYDDQEVIILSTTENIVRIKQYNCIDIGSKENLLEISHNIFSILRKIDNYNAKIAVIEGVKPEGLGLAIMNRLIRACEYDYIEL